MYKFYERHRDVMGGSTNYFRVSDNFYAKDKRHIEGGVGWGEGL